MAAKYEHVLVNNFGSDGGLNENQFYNAFMYVKGEKHHHDQGSSPARNIEDLDDAFGCPGSDWGNTVEERAESDCIFNKIGSGADELHKPEITGALFQYC